ncbi:hypothetical protein DPMN_091602 [Dreissena polymorpha]|uniref:Uncharacterized protein n=1 Tax=Dreissena polymorpha TaxID=45954 RepID=A0A9D4L2E0_DREPO|nr:hypothetical protein DPMN_091602 [Dreissena polymorpha]
MEVSTEKSKIMVNSNTKTSADIAMNNEKPGDKTNFTYLGATLTKNGTSTNEVGIAIIKLSRFWGIKQLHQFPHQVQILLVPHRLNLSIRL